MKIGVVRGDFISSWEIPIFKPWTKKNEVTLFLGQIPIYKVEIPKTIRVKNLFSPVDLNFGKVNRYLMAVLNRIFIDAHVLFGLVWKLRGFDVAYTAETFYFFTFQCILARKLGFIKKVAMHVGENIAFNNEGIWGRKLLKKFAIKNTDVFICITEQAKDVLILEGADPKKIVRANPGVDLTLFKPEIPKRVRDDIKLLVVSRLIPEKGIAEIINAFKNLKAIYKNISLTVVGTGPESSKLIGQEGVTLFDRLSQKELVNLYNKSDIFVHYPKGSKTWIEQYGFVLIEAMACGLPIVALDKGSIKEVVGEGGIVVNKRLFEKSLEKLVKDPKLRDFYAGKALNYAKKKYNVLDYSARLEAVMTN